MIFRKFKERLLKMKKTFKKTIVILGILVLLGSIIGALL